MNFPHIISYKHLKNLTSFHSQTSSPYYKILMGESGTDDFGHDNNVFISLEENIRSYKKR